MSQPPPFQFREALAFVVSKFEREFSHRGNLRMWTHETDLAEFKAHFCKCICYSMHQIANGLDLWKFPMFEGRRIARVPLQLWIKRTSFPHVFRKFRSFIMECLEHLLGVGPEHRVHVVQSNDTDYFKNQHMTFSLHYKGFYYRFRLEEFGEVQEFEGDSARHWCFCSPIKLQYEYVH